MHAAPLLALAAGATLAALPAGAAARQAFDLRGGPAAPGFVSVAAGAAYLPGGYGYEPPRAGDAFLFSVALPEGLYRVTVTLGGSRPSRTTVKAESRRLMLAEVRARAGERVSRSFLVAVRTPALAPLPPTAPGGTAVRLAPDEAAGYDWDDRLTLEFLGTPAVATIVIEPAEAPTIFLAGDSTVADQPAEPAASWGQMLPALFDDRIAIANHAHSGETLKSFLTALRLDKLLGQARSGDWLLIQFGHNDQKQQWPQTYADAAQVYPAYLRAYIAEARRRGIRPILVTPPERRNFDRAGRITDTLGDFVAAVNRVGAEEGVPVLDLNAASRSLYQALGPVRAAAAFNDGGRDRTHNNAYGAWLLANAVAQALAGAVPELAPHIAAGARKLDLTHPLPPERFALPASLASTATRPAGN